jgi:hypothetical protein
MNEAFYLSLNSNADGEYYEHNTSANFRTHLGKMLLLENAWEVALVEVKVPMTLYNVPQKICKVMRQSLTDEKMVFYNYYLRPGFYSDAATLILELNNTLKGEIEFFLDKSSIVSITTKKASSSEIFYLETQLAKILGLADSKISNKHEMYKGVRPVKPNYGLCSTLNVNTNIIEHQFVDNSHNSTLRSFTTYAERYGYGFDKHYNFQKFQYRKLNCNRLEHIEINISNESNQDVSFGPNTSTSVLLHFRRCIE